MIDQPENSFVEDPSTTPVAEDPESAFFSSQRPLKLPRLTTRDLDPPGADKLGLTVEEADQFRESGFVIKRGLIPEGEFSPFIDLWWQQPPVLAARMSRRVPASWQAPGERWPVDNRWGLAEDWMGGGVWPAMTADRPGATVGERVGRLPYKLTRDISNDVWRWHGIGHDEAFVAATSAHPRVLHMTEVLLGGPVKRPRRNRGIYSIFPRDQSSPASRLGPHMDQNMTEMMAVMYLEDVDPLSGGFTIYPASAQRLYPTSSQALNWAPTERSQQVMDDIVTNAQPLEFVGKAGDVLFCHGWTVHSAGIHEGSNIRIAAIHDFNKVRRRGHMRWTAAGKRDGERINCNMDGEFLFPTDSTEDDPADGMREVTNQWIMDSNEFVQDRQPPLDDMFEEWNLGQRAVGGSVVDEPVWWEKYRLPLLPSGNVVRGGGGMPAVPLSQIAVYEGAGVWRAELHANDWMS